MKKTKTNIDWKSLIKDYNVKYGTAFKTEKEMLINLSRTFSPQEISNRFKISCSTTYQRMDNYGIKRSHTRGGPNNTKTPVQNLFLSIPANKMVTMTAKQIASKLRLSIQAVHRVARITGRSYVKVSGRYGEIIGDEQ